MRSCIGFFGTILFVTMWIGCTDSPTSSSRNHAPDAPSSPSPADNAFNVGINPTFSWTGGDPDDDDVEYGVFITDFAGDDRSGTTSITSISLVAPLSYETEYFWQVTAVDEHNDTTLSPIWSFTTIEDPTPHLSVSLTSLSFGSSTTSLTFDITNTGGGTLSWSITDNQTWLSVSPTSGSTTTETDQITVTVSRSGLSSGTYNGTITVTPSSGTSQTVSVSMTVSSTALFSEGFEISVVPGSLWLASDANSTYGLDYWGDQSSGSGARVYTGNYSAYCADNSDVTGQFYDDYMNSYMQLASPVNVSGHPTYQVSYWVWFQTENAIDYCSFQYWNGSAWIEPSGARMTGSSGAWVQYTINFTGGTSLYFQWVFYSDYSVAYEGAYIDDIAVQATSADVAGAILNRVEDTGRTPPVRVSQPAKNRKD